MTGTDECLHPGLGFLLGEEGQRVQPVFFRHLDRSFEGRGHGASLIVTAGHTASIEEFFDRSRQHSNPSTFLTRLKVGEKLVDAKAVATLYRSRVSGGAIALLVLAMLVAVIVALWVSRADAALIEWVVDYWNQFLAVGSGLGHLGVTAVISLRSHAISLAAVFLALAIGSRPGLRSAVQHRAVRTARRQARDCRTRSTRSPTRRMRSTKSSAPQANSTHRCRRGFCATALADKSVVLFRTPDAADDDVDALSRLVERGRRHRHRHRRADPGVRRRQLRGETALGGELADRARGRPVEHQARSTRGRRPATCWASRC